MVDKIFIDTDVIIDLLTDREPHAQFSSELIGLCDSGDLLGCTSSLVINNVHYVCRKVVGDKKAKVLINELLEVFDILPVSKQQLQNALKSKITDFEDAIQHEVALSDNKVKAIITRNIKDFKKSNVPVFSPDSYLRLISRA